MPWGLQNREERSRGLAAGASKLDAVVGDIVVQVVEALQPQLFFQLVFQVFIHKDSPFGPQRACFNVFIGKVRAPLVTT